MQFERRGEWLLPPTNFFLAAKRAFITDGRAISYAESCMGIIEYYRLGKRDVWHVDVLCFADGLDQ
jgi:hypothetical protein